MDEITGRIAQFRLDCCSASKPVVAKIGEHTITIDEDDIPFLEQYTWKPTGRKIYGKKYFTTREKTSGGGVVVHHLHRSIARRAFPTHKHLDWNAGKITDPDLMGDDRLRVCFLDGNTLNLTRDNISITNAYVGPQKDYGRPTGRKKEDTPRREKKERKKREKVAAVVDTAPRVSVNRGWVCPLCSTPISPASLVCPVCSRH